VSKRCALVTGGAGQLGMDLAAQLADGWEVAAPPHDELDVADEAQLAAAFERTRPELVFNCAAFHNVDVCEREAARSFEVNATAVRRLGRLCAERDAALVHLSTNYVFAGDRPEPYTEYDLPEPRSVYAISKLAGEHAAMAYCPDALVVRTAGLYGLHGSASKGGNFVQRMLARAREQDVLRMVADQRLTPTYTADLSAALVEAVEAGARGLLHLTNDDECSWYEFTEAIMDIAGVETSLEAVSTTVPEGGAQRPLNGVLARARADELELTPLRPWRAALTAYMVDAGLASERLAER
jgi:dTDP-4-dehydrorhamnose reductase